MEAHGDRIDLAAAEHAALVLRSDDGPFVPDLVRERLREIGVPSAARLAGETAPPSLAPVQAEGERGDALAAEHAYATTVAIAALVAELQTRPARLLVKGGIALPDARRLATVASREQDELDPLLSVAERASLTASGDELVAVVDEGWDAAPVADRWRVLASAWLGRIPADLRAMLAERAHVDWHGRLQDFIDWLFPAADDTMQQRVRDYVRDARLLGLIDDHTVTSAGALLLDGEAAAAAAALAEQFPTEVDRVYVQHDLTVVSPGPLRSDLDRRVRALADVERPGIATTYRISESSLARAFADGETAEGLRELLTEISLTGIPQPLDYLIGQTAARHDILSLTDADPGTLIASDDATLLRTLAVDTALGMLDLQSVRGGLYSRMPLDVVRAALADARHPVPAAPATSRAAHGAGRPRAVASDPYAALLERLRVGQHDDGDDDWVRRQLDLAIRGRLALTVTIRMPGGTEQDFVLEPAAIAGGRLRARDRKADLERTLPLTSIVTVAPAD